MRNIKVETTSIKYRCLRCGRLFTAKKLSKERQLKCPECGFPVIEKARRDMAIHIKAR